jgi:hypothetical protein
VRFDTARGGGYPLAVENEDEIRELMGKLIEAVEASLATSAAVREALADLVRQGYEARLYFVANAESADAAADDDEDTDESGEAEGVEPSIEIDARIVPELGVVRDSGEPRFELTKLDRDFLKSLHMRPETG